MEGDVSFDSWVDVKDIDDDENEPIPLYKKSIEDLLAEAASDEILKDKKKNVTDGDIVQQQPSTSSSPGSSLIVKEIPSSEAVVESTDWIWDWPARPESEPPEDFKGVYSDADKTKYYFSFRTTKPIKSGFSASKWKAILPTLLLTHLITLGIGFVIGYRFVFSKIQSVGM